LNRLSIASDLLYELIFIAYTDDLAVLDHALRQLHVLNDLEILLLNRTLSLEAVCPLQLGALHFCDQGEQLGLLFLLLLVAIGRHMDN
jgi:hypothetical protein